MIEPTATLIYADGERRETFATGGRATWTINRDDAPVCVMAPKGTCQTPAVLLKLRAGDVLRIKFT